MGFPAREGEESAIVEEAIFFFEKKKWGERKIYDSCAISDEEKCKGFEGIIYEWKMKNVIFLSKVLSISDFLFACEDLVCF